MNSDHIIRIGKTHKLCQDYARCSNNIVIVSDGCSSSPDSDFGARLITKIAENFHSKYTLYGEDFYQSIINKAHYLSLELELNQFALDATFLSIRNIEDKLIVDIVGDGYLIIKYKTNLVIYHFEYPSNYPEYLSYKTNEVRMRNVKAININQPFKTTKYTISNETTVAENYILEKNYIILDKTDIEFCIVSTDGLGSFVHENNSSVDFISVGEKLTNIQFYKGCFLQRSFNGLMKEFNKQKINHFDDIGIAGFCLLGD